MTKMNSVVFLWISTFTVTLTVVLSQREEEIRATYQRVDALCNEAKAFSSDYGPTVTCFKDAHDYFADNCLPGAQRQKNSCDPRSISKLFYSWFRSSNDWHEAFYQCLEGRSSDSVRNNLRRKRQSSGCPFAKLAAQRQRERNMKSSDQSECTKEVNRRISICIDQTTCPNFASCYNNTVVAQKRDEKRMKQMAYIIAVGECSSSNSASVSSSAESIVSVASGSSDFSTLVTALGAADLVSVLSSPGPFTVFAPTNAAFSALPAGTLENLLLPSNKMQLANILRYHVVPGRVPSSEITGRIQPATLLTGQSLAINGGNGVLVNDAQVTLADIPATNGVIHQIDKVLLPPSTTN